MVIKAGSHTLEEENSEKKKKNPRAGSVKKQIRRKEQKNANYRETPKYYKKLKGL